MTTGYDVLNLRIRMFGRDHAISTPVRVGPAKAADLLLPARGICEGITAIAIERTIAEGRTITCRAGCGACCAQLVPIAPVEALRLAEIVDAMPGARRRTVTVRFENALRRLREIGLVARRAPPGQAALSSHAPTVKARWEDASRRYFDARIPCPFLEGGSCSIYPERPMVCREYHVTTPAVLCASMSPHARQIPRPVRMSEVMTSFTNRLLGRSDFHVPLTFSLEWARANRPAFERRGDGGELARDLVRCIQEADDRGENA